MAAFSGLLLQWFNHDEFGVFAHIWTALVLSSPVFLFGWCLCGSRFKWYWWILLPTLFFAALLRYEITSAAEYGREPYPKACPEGYVNHHYSISSVYGEAISLPPRDFADCAATCHPPQQPKQEGGKEGGGGEEIEEESLRLDCLSDSHRKELEDCLENRAVYWCLDELMWRVAMHLA